MQFRRFPNKTLIVFTVNAFRLLFFLSHPSFSCSFSRMKVCGTSFSFSWGTWFGSPGSERPLCSPSMKWRFPPFLKCSRSAWIPRCSDRPPSLPSGLSHWELCLSKDETKSVKRDVDKKCNHTGDAVIIHLSILLI